MRSDEVVMRSGTTFDASDQILAFASLILSISESWLLPGPCCAVLAVLHKLHGAPHQLKTQRDLNKS